MKFRASKTRFVLCIAFACGLACGPDAHGQESAKPIAPETPAAQAGDPQLKPNPLEELRKFEPSADEEYRLGRGDEITVDISGRPELEAKLIVGPDGRISLPLAGEMMVAGLTRRESAKALESALSAYYSNLAVQITVTKYTANRVLVLGAVEHPGSFTFEDTPTLLGALTRGGLPKTGPNNVPDIPEQCAIYRGSDQVMWVQLKSLIESGNPLADLRLRRDDVIYVPNMTEHFLSVLGEVQHPGPVQLTHASTLASVLASADGQLDPEPSAIQTRRRRTGEDQCVPRKHDERSSRQGGRAHPAAPAKRPGAILGARVQTQCASGPAFQRSRERDAAHAAVQRSGHRYPAIAEPLHGSG